MSRAGRSTRRVTARYSLRMLTRGDDSEGVSDTLVVHCVGFLLTFRPSEPSLVSVSRVSSLCSLSLSRCIRLNHASRPRSGCARRPGLDTRLHWSCVRRSVPPMVSRRTKRIRAHGAHSRPTTRANRTHVCGPKAHALQCLGGHASRGPPAVAAREAVPAPWCRGCCLPLHRARQEATVDRGSQIGKLRWGVVEEESVALRGVANARHHVKVLRDDHQVEHLLRVDPLHLLPKGVHRLAQSRHDRLPLTRDTLAAQVHRLRIRGRLDLNRAGGSLGVLDCTDLDGLTLVLRRLPDALRLVDLIHRVLDLGRRLDLRDWRREDLVAEGSKVLLEVGGDLLGNLLLLEEEVIQLDLRHARAHDVVHVRLDLRFRVGEAVVGIVHRLVVLCDLELDGNFDGSKNIVCRLGLAGNGELLEAHGQWLGGTIDAADEEAQARRRNVVELATALHKAHRACIGGDRTANHGGAGELPAFAVKEEPPP
mmetsp:Transcript_31496/g.82296  ORF Transcript_31496/g.82296 Transcript_31496/m.82296 type:complete len:480 (-) Transcript_31496:1-1440(-)